MIEITESTDHMQYQEGMEILDSEMLDTVLEETGRPAVSRKPAYKKPVLSRGGRRMVAKIAARVVAVCSRSWVKIS